jgi:hypothetical protein
MIIRVIFILIIFIATNSPPLLKAQEKKTVLISEVLVENQDSANAEFIELINVSATPVNIGDWRIEYLSDRGNNWLIRAELQGAIQPYDHFLLSTIELDISADLTLNSGLSKRGGHIRIVSVGDDKEIEMDKIGWGTAAYAEKKPAEPTKLGQSLKRRLNEDGQYIDTDNDYEDFKVSNKPSPQKSRVAELQCKNLSINEQLSVALNEVVAPPDISKSYSKVELSELLVDPKLPARDTENEYVEIYNPNQFSVDIADYVIESGFGWRYSYKLPAYVLKPFEYLAVFSAETDLTLANAGGKARILNPLFEELDLSSIYDKAKPGQSWAKIDGKWVWSTPTPNQINSPPNKEDSEQVLIKQSGNPSIYSDRSSKVNTTPTATDRNIYVEPPKVNSINTAVLVSIGLLALLYALYEYRREFKDYYQKLRSYLAAWRIPWRKP